MRSNVSMFADDHQAYEIDNNVSNIQTKPQASAQKTTIWYESNSLKGNYGKYGSMFISRVNKLKDHKLKLNVNRTDIKAYDSITLLGVDIDNALNFSGHIRNICKKSSQRVGVINRLRNLIPQNAKLQLFKGAILPHLTYCSTVWNFCRASDSRQLERVQERAVYCDSNSTAIRNCYKGQNYPLYIIEGSKILQF